jgi:LuxR family glucitol operon transcriptional activator
MSAVYGADLVRLLRQRLSETDARDIGNDFGVRACQGVRLYDRLPGEGLDARISSLVDRAQQLDEMAKLLSTCQAWRPDLQPDLTALIASEEGNESQTFHNLPPRYGQFLGRETDVARVIEGLSSRYPLISIEGIGGIGKTSLAIEAAHMSLGSAEPPLESLFEYAVWVSAVTKPNQKLWLHEVFNKIALVMNYFSITQLPLEEIEKKRSQIDRLLRSHRVLVVIDNFETIEDEDLVTWIESIPEPSHVLITTRQSRLQKTFAVSLRGLKQPEALRLVRQEAHALALNHIVDEEDEQLLPLIQVTDGNPQAIVMSLGYIKGGNLSFDEVVQQLEEAGDQVDDIFDYLFTKSWDLLPDDGRTILLSVPLFTGSVSREALKTVSGLNAYQFGQALRLLVNTKLLEVDHKRQRFMVHPMTHAFARKKLGRRHQFEEAARERWVRYYRTFVTEHTVRSSPDVPYWNSLVSDAMAALDEEWLSLIEVLTWADHEGRRSLVLDLVLLLIHYMDSRFLNLERIYFVLKATEAARLLERQEDEALLRIDALGWTYVEEHRLEQAKASIIAGMNIAREAQSRGDGGMDPIALGWAWLARMSIEEEQFDEADELIDRALETACNPWIRYRINMAAGDIALREGNSHKALQLYQDAVEQYESYGGEGRGYQILPRIGLAYVAIGDLKRAEDQFNVLRAQEQIAIGRLYAEYGMALIAYRRGEVDDARRLANAAKQQMSRRTASNLLLKLIEKLFEDLEAGYISQFSDRKHH